MSSDAHHGGSPRPTEPRIPPLSPDDADEQARELLAQAGGPTAGATNIFATFVRHPGLFRKWMPFGGKLLAGKLPARDRELLILRTGWNCRSDYEFAQHVRIGRAAGLTDEEIDRVTQGPEAEGWSDHDALLVRAADELHTDACLSDATWAALAAVGFLRSWRGRAPDWTVVALAASPPPVPQEPPARPTPVQEITGYPAPPPPSLSTWLTETRFDILFAVAAVAAVTVYLTWVRRLHRRGDHWFAADALAMA